MSLKHKIKSSRPRIAPCGMPDLMACVSGTSPPSTTIKQITESNALSLKLAYIKLALSV